MLGHRPDLALKKRWCDKSFPAAPTRVGEIVETEVLRAAKPQLPPPFIENARYLLITVANAVDPLCFPTCA
jgi:hypothetical protein